MSESASPAVRFIGELRRRRVFRTAAIYIVSSWLVMQVADVLFPAMDIPDRAIRYVFLAALAGFPAALVFGWFYDVGAHGIRRTPQAGPAELEAGQALGRSDYILLTALTGVVIAILYNTIGNVVDEPADPVAISPAERTGPPVIAVLPFTTTSLEAESEFFAAGVHDDLLTQLSKLQSIRVISRTSVLEYAGTTRNIREIGTELGADVVMEGGVQVAGEQIRINAQLIKATTDEHLWAETYDRSLTAANIFDVQQDIARHITEALNTTLTEQDDERLGIVPTENMAAYRLYRKAMDARTGHGMSQEDRVEMLKQVVKMDPGFVRAWAELAGVYSLMAFDGVEDEYVLGAEQALDQIKALAPGSAEYFIAQAYYIYYVVKDYDQAHLVLGRAIATNPSDTSLLELRSWIERRQGDFQAREQTLREIIQLDPRNESYQGQFMLSLITRHQYDEALEAIDTFDQSSVYPDVYHSVLRVKDHGDFGIWLEETKKLEGRLHGNDRLFLWQAYISNRMYTEAAEIVEQIPETPDLNPGMLSHKQEASLYTYWLMNDQEKLNEITPGILENLELARLEDGTFSHRYVYGDMARVRAAQGEKEESLRLLRKYLELEAGDWAGRVLYTDVMCALFGMNGAVIEAVECLRRGLRDPSYVMPFITPYEPYYDSIREAPEFVELVTEIENAGSR